MKRPVLRYFGGKFRIRKWILSHFPPHDVYIEPFGGAASVLLSKPRTGIEIYNDLDDCVVNLFRVLRDRESAMELQRLLHLTPYARQELEVSFDRSDDPIEDARRTVVRAFLGIGSDGAVRRGRTGFRSQVTRRGGKSISDWYGYPPCVEIFCERMREVIIESRSAVDVIKAYDSPVTLHYIDPPYVLKTRSTSNRHGYQYEMSDADHRDLLDLLRGGVEGMVVLSAYRSSIYDEALSGSGWECNYLETRTAGKDAAVECLWTNPAASEAQQQQPMFPTEARDEV